MFGLGGNSSVQHRQANVSLEEMNKNKPFNEANCMAIIKTQALTYLK
jgi:hypothetical protein